MPKLLTQPDAINASAPGTPFTSTAAKFCMTSHLVRTRAEDWIRISQLPRLVCQQRPTFWRDVKIWTLTHPHKKEVAHARRDIPFETTKGVAIVPAGTASGPMKMGLKVAGIRRAATIQSSYLGCPYTASHCRSYAETASEYRKMLRMASRMFVRMLASYDLQVERETQRRLDGEIWRGVAVL